MQASELACAEIEASGLQGGCCPRQSLLRPPHTLRHYETAFWDSSVADNNSFEQWRDAGATSADGRTAKAWRQVLSEYQPPTIDTGVDEALGDFVARRKAASEDRWY